QRNPTPVIAHRYQSVFDSDFNRLPGSHDEFIDTVVDDLLQKNVDPVVGRTSVAQFPNVHTGTHTDMLLPIEGTNIIFGIIGYFGHATSRDFALNYTLGNNSES